jgi:hypothetical protein
MSIHTIKNLGKTDIVLKLDKRSFCPPGFWRAVLRHAQVLDSPTITRYRYYLSQHLLLRHMNLVQHKHLSQCR